MEKSGLIIKGQYSDDVEQLMKLTPNKRHFYQQGMRAATLIQSIS
jgi:hypothetical protein